MGRPVLDYVGEKWGGGPHYRGVMEELGEDEHGTWLWGPAGRTITRGGEPVFVTAQDLVALIPVGGWWAASWSLGHPELELYVNVNTPAVRTAGAVTYIDLDLDVVRRLDGTCEIIDQDEFELHQVELAYPQEVIERTARTAEEVLRSVRAGEPPFDGRAALEWAAVARS